MIGDKFITICRELGPALERVIWQEEVKEKLEDVIENFLETGNLEYTTIPFEKNEKSKKIKEKLYPKIDKVLLFEQIGRFRKRKQGNIIARK